VAEVRITISAKDGTQQVFRAVEEGAKSAFSSIDNAANNSGSRTKSALDGIKASWVAITAAITAAVATVITVIKSLVDQAALAARVETLGVVLNVVGRNAGYSAQQMQGYVEGVKRMGITTQESLSSVIRMTQAHMDLSKASQLARISQDAAVLGNINSSQALATMVQGIQSGEVEILRGIGINVNFEQSYEKLAQKLGKSTEALTEQEKVTARTNIVLEAGKTIAGTYAASMDTVGKQAKSLARPLEEAQVKMGELFKPSFAALVTMAGDALTGLNKKLTELKNSGDLAKWGEAGASTISFLAQNAIPLAIGGLGLMISTVVSLISKFEVLQKVSTAALSSPNLLIAGGTAAAVGGNMLGQWMNENMPGAYDFMGKASRYVFPGLSPVLDWANARNQRQQEWEKQYDEQMKGDRQAIAEDWKKTQKQLEESGIKGIHNDKQLIEAEKSGDIVQYKVKIGVDSVTGLDIVQYRFKDVRNELQKTKEQIDATTKGFATMSTVLDQMGGMSLKLGGEDLRRQVAQEVLDMRALSTEYQALSDAVKTGLQMDRQADQMDRITKAFAEYGVTIDSVYGNQINLQKEVLAEVTNYETKQSNISKQAANVTETEIKANEAKLANYRSYYDELTKLRKAYYDEAVKSAANIAKLDRDMATGRKEASDLLYEMWNKKNPAANETEEWNRRWLKLEQDAAYAATLPIDKQAEAYQKLAQSYSDMGKVITQTEMERQLVTSGQGFQTSTEFQDVQITRYVDTWQLAESKVIEMMGRAQASQQAMRDQEAQNQAQALQGIARVTSAMEGLETAIKETETTLTNLDNLLAQQKVLSIDVSGALPGLTMVRDYLVEINRLTGQKVNVSSAPSGASSHSIDEIDYVPGPYTDSYGPGMNWDGSQQVVYSEQYARPSVGPALVPIGGAVAPTKESISGGSITVNGGITVKLPESVKIDDPRSFAEQVAPALREEFKRIEGRK